MYYPIENYLTAKRGFKFGQPTSYTNFHLGEDLIGKLDDPIYTVDDGEIVEVGHFSEGGLTIHLKLNKGELVRYLHLNKIEFNQTGIKVKSGQIIGRMGNTGKFSSGVHLHIDISKNGKLELNNLSNFVNPEDWMKENIMPNYPDNDSFTEKFNRIQRKFKDKLANSFTIPYTTKRPDGTAQRNIIRRTKEGKIIEKNDASVEEWIAAFSVWD